MTGPAAADADRDPDAEADLAGLVAFLQDAAALKDTLRSGHTAAGARESTAAHSWRLALLALLVAPRVPGVDALRLLELCIVHDLGEAISGDVSATQADAAAGKAARERADLRQLCAPLPAADRDRLMALWEEYEAAETAEARIAKGLDKIETILTHAIGANTPDFDYAFNLDYGAARTRAHPLLAAMRRHADAATRSRMGG